MQFHIPVGVTNNIERRMRDFLGEGKDDLGVITQWFGVLDLRLRSQGLGIGNIVKKNVGLLMKWLVFSDGAKLIMAKSHSEQIWS